MRRSRISTNLASLIGAEKPGVSGGYLIGPATLVNHGRLTPNIPKSTRLDVQTERAEGHKSHVTGPKIRSQPYGFQECHRSSDL